MAGVNTAATVHRQHMPSTGRHTTTPPLGLMGGNCHVAKWHSQPFIRKVTKYQVYI